MYSTLLTLHSVIRWAAFIALSCATVMAIQGYINGSRFTSTYNRIRHWTATILHIQLTIGLLLYFASPLVTYYWNQPREGRPLHEAGFFALIHSTLMFVGIIVASFGSAFAKRKENDREKFKTMAIFFGVALLIILIAIPWPFSPLITRPYFRTF